MWNPQQEMLSSVFSQAWDRPKFTLKLVVAEVVALPGNAGERREAERQARAAAEQDVGLDDGKIDAEQAESEQEEMVSEEENLEGNVIPPA